MICFTEVYVLFAHSSLYPIAALDCLYLQNVIQLLSGLNYLLEVPVPSSDRKGALGNTVSSLSKV